MDEDIIAGIERILKSKAENGNGNVILNTGLEAYNRIMMNRQGLITLHNTKDRSKIGLREVTDYLSYSIYCTLDANSRLSVTEQQLYDDTPELKKWAREPYEVRSGDEVIGMIGIAIEETSGENELRSVIFISPDGTYATLTMYSEESKDEKSLAGKDLSTLAGEILRARLLI